MTGRRFALLLAAAAVALAAFASPFAASAPDGLSRVAADHGFADRERERGGPIAGYAAPGVRDERAATGAAGLIGTLLVLTAGGAVALLLRARSRAEG